jgi:site-specific DNA-methyltransferase (adenine-specific)
MDDVTLIEGDCLQIMPTLPPASFDMICADLPYGTTACSWDVVIPFEPLWAEYKRLIKPRGAIVLFGSQPFTSLLVCSNLEWFKYVWVWEKTIGTDHWNAHSKPVKAHEDVAVFSPGTVASGSPNRMKFNPQRTAGDTWIKRQVTDPHGGVYGDTRKSIETGILRSNTGRHPRTIIRFANPNHANEHPTQKPVALLEYLIRTYTNEGDAVLDNTMGSGTTLVACIQTGRRGTGIELRRDYFEIAEERCRKARLQPPLRPNQEIKLTRTEAARSEVDSSDEAQPVLLVG